ncbi:uncharacterized protein BJX67DRAFT_62659 [Aspergillus lucknowensis]|uniref:M protein repeat protein n=1 Tax=Aspergillus lucknowensis TaxID=176173 RepID=A0ABR4LUI4_9EURO
MADEEERLKAEKLAAAKKRVAALQKKKKAGKKGASSSSEAPNEAGSDVTETAPAQEAEKEEDEKEEKGEEEGEAPSEPMPEAPTLLEGEGEAGAEAEAEAEATGTAAGGTKSDAPRAGHTRQPSLSIQSKMRSSSFRKSSISQSTSPSPSAMLKSPTISLPPLSADGGSVQEVYRKQSSRIEELERENKRLEREVEEVTGKFKKTEDQLEDLREASVDVAELRERLREAEGKVEAVEELKAEIASLQRQNSHLQTSRHRSNASISVPGTSESPPSDLVQQLESKSAAVEAMELEISNLRAQISTQSTHETQIAALEEKVSRSESALARSQRELTDAKNALTRASEKAVKEGVDKTSTETLIKSLQREIEELKHEKTEAEKKIDTLEKKLQAIGNLHKESEARHQARLRENEKFEKEAAILRKKLASTENENLRLKEEQEALRNRDAGSGGGGADDDALDELEDEERSRLQRRIRELEGENFDLRRGVWKEKRQELQEQGHHGPDDYASPDFSTPSAANAFDDVDLVGGSPEHSRRRSMAQRHSQHHPHAHQQQQHSSFSTVLSSGIAAFRGSGSPFYARPSSSSHSHHAPGTRGSLELLSEENFDDEFDEAEFARAQAEEEARKRVEWVREIKKQLRDWKGWRLDLVDSRAGAEGAGVGMGEIFEI